MTKKLVIIFLLCLIILGGCKKKITPDIYVHFLAAIHYRDYDKVKNYIDTYDGIMDIPFDVVGEGTVLIAAVGLEDDRMVNLFINEGINLETQLSDGTTALHIIIKDGYTKYVKILLDAGANPNAKDNKGYTIFHFALVTPSTEMLDLLLEYSDEIDQPDNMNATPLAMAMNDDREGLEPIILWFLKNGANFKKVLEVSPGIVPYYIHIRKNEVLKYLFENEPLSLEFKDQEGNMVSHFSVGYENKEILDYLLENDLFSNEENDKGETPLDMAIKWELPEMEASIRDFLNQREAVSSVR